MSTDRALRQSLEAAVRRATGSAFRIERMRAASGGCVHRSFAVEGAQGRYFVKTNEAALADAFAAEADGLTALVAAGVRAPAPLCHGSSDAHAWLVMEYLELGGRGDYSRLGSELARLHSCRGRQYGWRRDNYIGSTPQRNRTAQPWAAFWQTERLLPQLELARRNGLGTPLVDAGEQLAAALPALLAGHEPAPSLVHGDLWSGNAAFLAGGTPVLFDPAVHYGDREVDVAMTELFGGFPPAFYGAYRAAAPLDPGYATRKTLYNLYHVLNHANLFGGGYGGQAEQMIARLLADIR